MSRLYRNLSSPRDLSKSWGFRILTFAIIAYSTKPMSVLIHGLIGFFALLGIAWILMHAKRELGIVHYNIRHVTALNKPLLFFSMWYAFGVIFNIYFRGGFYVVEDWRLTMGPFLLLWATFFAFAFLHNDKCYRILVILLTLLAGVQSIFTLREQFFGFVPIRQLVNDVWLYGDQGTFAMYAILFPVLIVQATKEKKTLCAALYVCCGIIAISIVFCTFATAVALLLIGGAGLSIITLGYWRKSFVAKAALCVLLATMTVLTFKLVIESSNPLLRDVNSRLIRAYQDPTSGGYNQHYGTESRWFLAQKSIDSFLDNPLFGAGGGSIRHSTYVGGHSSFFDSLGGYGLLGGGGAFISLILYMLFQTFHQMRVKRSLETIAKFIVTISLLIGGIVNPYWEGNQTLMVLLVARSFRY